MSYRTEGGPSGDGTDIHSDVWTFGRLDGWTEIPLSCSIGHLSHRVRSPKRTNDRAVFGKEEELEMDWANQRALFGKEEELEID